MTEPAMEVSVGVNITGLQSGLDKALKVLQKVPAKVTVEANAKGVEKLGTDLATIEVGTRNVTTASDRYLMVIDRQQRELSRLSLTLGQNNNMLLRQQSLYQSATGPVDDATRSWELNGLEIASATNHMKQAAVVAYTLSPAFRAMVNPAIVAGLGLTGKALAAMGPSAANVAVAVGSRMGPALASLARYALPVMVVKDAFDFMSYSTELAKRKVEEWSDLADKANASGFSTQFFQRITKAAKDARNPIDDLTEALKRFNDASTNKLGGSTLSNRLGELTKAGNFKGNTGVGAVAVANDPEQRFRATIDLIDQAMAKGERLAAIDLAGTVFGPQVQDALRADSGYLDDMLRRADAISKSKLVSDEDIGRAMDLKLRMEAAQQILTDKWKPVQEDIAKLGMQYHASMVDLTEDMAKAVGYATDLYTELKKVPDWFVNRIGNASIWKSLTDASGALGLNSVPSGLVMKGEPEFGQTEANAKLAAAMKNRNNMTRAMQDATETYTRVLGDNSKALGDNAKRLHDTGPFDQAVAAIRKRIVTMQADTVTVGQGAGGLAALRQMAAQSANTANDNKEAQDCQPAKAA